MLYFLEEVVKAYQEGEKEIIFDCLQSAEFSLRVIEERNSVEQELLGFIDDIMYYHKEKNYDNALLFTKMAIDLATLPYVEGYRYNETGFNTVQAELDEHVDTPIDIDNDIECIEWDMKYRKLQGRLIELLIADHRARFGKHALLA